MDMRVNQALDMRIDETRVLGDDVEVFAVVPVSLELGDVGWHLGATYTARENPLALIEDNHRPNRGIYPGLPTLQHLPRQSQARNSVMVYRSIPAAILAVHQVESVESFSMARQSGDEENSHQVATSRLSLPPVSPFRSKRAATADITNDIASSMRM